MLFKINLSFAFLFLLHQTADFAVHSASIGINSLCRTPITNNQFENLKSQGYVCYEAFHLDAPTRFAAGNFGTLSHFDAETFFIGNYFNGALVTDANTLKGLYAGVNNNGIYSIGNASIGGITQLRDAYHIPKFTASAPLNYPSVSGPTTNLYAQARLPIDLLNGAKGSIGRTWLVILNGVGSNWSSNLSENEKFIREFVSYFPKPLGPQIGIMTSNTDYWSIVSSTFSLSDSNSASIQLWWSNCTTGYQDYTNYVPFNNWYHPVMHRYNCSISNIGGQNGVDGDLDWFA